MSHEFQFDDGLKLTVNKDSITIVVPEESAHILKSIYVLELKDEVNAFIVYKNLHATHGFGVYELENTPKEGHILENFIGFLTIRMPYISNIKQRPYMQKFGINDEIKLKRGWRLSFEEFDYDIHPNGPSRNGVRTQLPFNRYFCTGIV